MAELNVPPKSPGVVAQEEGRQNSFIRTLGEKPSDGTELSSSGATPAALAAPRSS